jgi:tagaturonate epimerase
VRAFEASLTQHVAVARYCGPYKISVHSGSDKFAIYPVVGRVCGDLLHVKTAGTSYLEALRVAARQDPKLFGEIAAYAHERFATDRASYHISTTEQETAALKAKGTADLEHNYLDERVGRQLLHVTFGSVLTLGRRANGQPFKDALLDVLRSNAALHDEFLERHFDKHLNLLSAG